jgi:ribosome recycling factor
MSHPILADAQARMKKAVDHTLHEFSSIHTGKATPTMVEGVMVEAYGSTMRLKECAAISTPDARMIQVQPWDVSLTKAIAKGIIDANLGFNPIVDGTNLRIPLPELNEQRRKELVKISHGYAENARVAARHVRRDGMDFLKKAEKDGDISEDDQRKRSDQVQKLTDETISTIDHLLSDKEAEIMQV